VDASQLNVMVTEGTVVFHAVGSPDDDVAFIRSYTVQLSISAWGGNPDKLDAAIVWWLSLYQTELAGDGNGYGFEAEILNSETVNLYALINLEERVIYDRATDTMRNCVGAVLLDDTSMPAMPLFIADAMTGDEWEVGNDG
jgi:hypothetical protein